MTDKGKRAPGLFSKLSRRDRPVQWPPHGFSGLIDPPAGEFTTGPDEDDGAAEESKED